MNIYKWKLLDDILEYLKNNRIFCGFFKKLIKNNQKLKKIFNEFKS